MALVLPSTVEDINLQQSLEFAASQDIFGKPLNKDFMSMPESNRFKGGVNLPKVNIKSANDFTALNSFESYFLSPIDSQNDFKDILFKDEDFKEDRLVPEEGLLNSRQRCDSLSSIASSLDDKLYQQQQQRFPVKTFSTIRMDSGSTCIDQGYVAPSPSSMLMEQPADETYHNLDLFLQQVPEMAISENLPSPLSVSGSNSNFDFALLHTGGYSMHSSSQDSFMGRGLKRPASTEDLFSAKQMCPSPSPVQNTEVRRKNNIASKNCRKTRKEKQKEMETQLTDLQAENGELQMQIKVLEEMINASKMQLYAILHNKR